MSDESEQPRPSQPTQVGVALLGPSAPEPADTGQGGGADDIDVDVDDGPGVRLSTGKVIPGTRYRLIRWLGEGGMGVVYEAEHVDIERRVALKILRVDLSKRAEMAQIFRDEARAASRMGSPFIVDIYDFGELPDGRLFFCMELLDGNDLVPPSEEAWTPPERAIPILRQICKALSTAHGAGVVHRDVKPENIIVVRRGGREHVKIVDFGIAAMLAVGPRRRLKIAGTPHYMAPEQILGKPFDGRLDMYAVGCLAYELLVGHTPFTGETMDAVMTAQVHDDPPPLAKLRPERRLPPALCAAVMRCLAKRPEDRFRDMNDLEAALCEAQIAAGLRTDWDDLPLPEVEPERLARLRRDMPHPHGELRRRHPWLWPAVAALSGVIAISSITYAYMNREPTSDEQRLVDQLTNAARAAASTNYYITGPEEAPEESALRSVLALESLGGAVAGLASERAAELRRDFADTLIRLGDRYYDVEGARYFAIEYYLWARTFDPENRHAIERSLLDDTRFGVFLHNAGAGDFTATERQLMELASALAEDNTAKRDARITAVTAKMCCATASRCAASPSRARRASTSRAASAPPSRPNSPPSRRHRRSTPPPTPTLPPTPTPTPTPAPANRRPPPSSLYQRRSLDR